MSLEAAYSYLKSKTGEAFVSADELEIEGIRYNRLYDLVLMVEFLDNLTGKGFKEPTGLPFESLDFSASELRRLHDLYSTVLYPGDENE